MDKYAILINRLNPIPPDFLGGIRLADTNSIFGKKIKIEEKTFSQYKKLAIVCLVNNIIIGIVSSYRSEEEQAQILADEIRRFGKEHADRYVAPVGASEHHSGLAVDITISLDGGKSFLEDNGANDLMIRNEDAFLRIHEELPRFGFILRYPKGREHITGYAYEPWHLRYVGDDVAKEIFASGLTLEEFTSGQKQK
jgi:LAS superfamily LD-carboxypeptidase LdcB